MSRLPLLHPAGASGSRKALDRRRLAGACAGLSVALVATLASPVTASSAPTTEGTLAAAQRASAEPHVGGAVVYRAEYGPDWIDPGLTWYNFAWTITFATNRPLYSSNPEHPGRAVPDLARGYPVVSDDRTTVTVSIRRNVRYSPPVDRRVTSADVKYAIERAFSENVPNGYVFTYFGDLVGAPDHPGPIADIPGIETPDAHTIVFHLARPTAASFTGALMLPITVPVPEEYAAPFDAETPSAYDTHVTFTGPYMIENDADGFLTGLGDKIHLVRNPNWDPAFDYRPAYLDKITYTFGPDLDRIVARTLNGSHQLCCDSSPSSVVSNLDPTYADQVHRMPGHGTRWVALNTTLGPLRNLNVRKAIAAAMDRRALRAVKGGRIAGRIAKHFLPPGVPGFRESHGYAGFPDAPYLAHPSGDQAAAKALMLRARRDGVRINRDGQYVGDRVLLMVASDSEPGLSVARSVKRQVQQLGFKIRLRAVPNDRMYFRWCGVRSARVAICPNVGWFFDYFDPQSLLQPTFHGDAIFDGGSNWSLLDDPAINEAMDQAAEVLAGPARWDAWADVNHTITRQVPGVPWLWDTDYQLESADVSGVVSPYTARWDLSFTSVTD
jgi:peptide/nickel transport system substrate-binding protein